MSEQSYCFCHSAEPVGYDLEMLHKFAKTFPESALTDFIDDYCRWLQLPLPDPEEEAEATTTEEQDKSEKPTKKEKLQRWRKKKRGPNAKERRKARRQAGKEGVLAENVDQEERDELVSSMTVSNSQASAILRLVLSYFRNCLTA